MNYIPPGGMLRKDGYGFREITCRDIQMVNRPHILALMLALVAVMSCISCSTSDTVTGAVSMSEVGTPRIITVLQDPW